MSPLDCSQIRDAFLAGASPETPELAQHLAECAACRELVQDQGALGQTLAAAGGAPEPAAAELLSAVEERLAAEKGARACLRARPTRERFALAVALCAAVGLASFVARGRSDFSGTSALFWMALSGVWLVAFAVSVAFGFSRVNRSSSPALERALTAAALAAPMFLALLSPFGSAAELDQLVPKATACLIYGSLSALPVAALLWALDRADAPSGSALVLGAAALGFAGNLALEVHCARSHPLHLALGHATVGLLWLALLVGWRALRPAAD